MGKEGGKVTKGNTKKNWEFFIREGLINKVNKGDGNAVFVPNTDTWQQQMKRQPGERGSATGK